MKSNLFSLTQFPSDFVLHDLIISGDVEKRSDILNISFMLAGPLSEIVIPSVADIPYRKNALWEETCFEFFLGLQNSEQYWEFNLSPAGHWNVYRFTAYRQGMLEEPSFTSLPFIINKQPDAFQLFLEFEMGKIIKEDQMLRIGINAVIKSVKGKTTYWALTHPGPQPDFHRKDGFTMEL